MRLSVTKKQMEFLKTLGVEDKEYTRDEIDDIVIETLADELMRHGFTAGQEDVNEIGDLCESIIDAIEESR